MFSKYFWLSLLLAIVYFLYSRGFYEKIKSQLMEGTLNLADTIYFGLNENSGGSKIFTISELERYTNLENGLYLSILGQVFDVTKGEKHYGSGRSYHAFTGRDASLAFITGEFDDKGLTDDISSLSMQQVKALNDWVQFYKTNYIYKGTVDPSQNNCPKSQNNFIIFYQSAQQERKGKLYGRYYNQDGSPTTEFYKIQEKLLLLKKEKALEEAQNRMFPPCNVEWNLDIGTVFWCTERSGGIDRDWVGVPRMFFETAQSSSRCTCIKLDSKEYEENKARFKEYDGCDKYATKCILGMNKM